MKKSHVQLSDKDRIKKRTQDFWSGKIGLGIIGGYMAYVLGAHMYMHPEMNIADLTSYVLDGMPKTFFVLSKVNPMPFLFFGIIWAIYFAIDYEKYVRTRDLATNPHGDAHFEDDFDWYDSEFVIDPNVVEAVGGKKVKTHYTPEHKKIVDRPRVNNKKDKDGQYKNKYYKACFQNSMIYADKVSLSLNGYWSQRNTNTMVFGGSGTGKSRFFLSPNLLQANSSVLVTDPSGEIMAGYGAFLEKMGYEVKCLNVSDMRHSTRYNPLHYIKDQSDIPVVVTTYMENTSKGKQTGGDDFWPKTTQALLCACIAYLWEVEDKSKCNFYNVLQLIRKAQAPEGDEDAVTEFDLMMQALGEANPNSYAYNCYTIYSLAPRKTANSILISTAVTLGTFVDNPMFNNLIYKDEMHLDRVGAAPYKLRKGAKLLPGDEEKYAKEYERGKLKKGFIHVEDFEKYDDAGLLEIDKKGRYVEGKPYKMAIFLAIPTADSTYNWLTASLYSMFFTLAYRRGELRQKQQKMTSPKLAWPARCLIDEAANIGKIPKLSEYLSTCRKYMITIVPVFQSFSQLTETYGKENANSIVGNCDATLFLGGIDSETIKQVGDRLGKRTIKTNSLGYSFGKSNSSSQNYQYTGQELLSRSQIELIDNTKCLVLIRAVSPFFVRKYRLEKHPNYRYTAEANPDEYSYVNPFTCEYDDEAIEACRIKAIGEDGYTEPVEVDSARLRALKRQRAKDRLPAVKSMRDAADTYALEPPANASARDRAAHQQYIEELTSIGRNALKYDVPEYDAPVIKIVQQICTTYRLDLGLDDLYMEESELIKKSERCRAIRQGADEAKLKELGLLDIDELDAESAREDGTNPSEPSEETSDEENESGKKEPPELPEFDAPHPLTRTEVEEKRAHAEKTLESLRIRSGEKNDNPGIKSENCIISEAYSPLAEFAPAPAVTASIIEMMEAEGLMEKEEAEELAEAKEDATEEISAANVVSETAASEPDTKSEQEAVNNGEPAQESTNESNDSDNETTSSATELPSFAPEEDNFFSPDGDGFMSFSDDDDDDDFGGGFSEDDFL